MRYVLLRCLRAVTDRRGWLIMIFLPAAVYLAGLALQADRFTVGQEIQLDLATPASVATSPVGTITVGDLVAMPNALFQDRFALAALRDRSAGSTARNLSGPEGFEIRDVVADTLSIRPVGADTVVIEYFGPNESQGRFLVGYFLQRLQDRVREGLVRSGQGAPGMTGDLSGGLTGSITVTSHRSLWRPERFWPSFIFTLVSLVAVCLVLIAVEWSDPAFKSERQAARYLEIPVLGSVPDLDVLSRTLKV